MKRYLIAGMSHVEALRRAWLTSSDGAADCHVDVLNLRCYRQPASSGQAQASGRRNTYIEPADIAADFEPQARGMDAAVLYINGNEHNLIGLTEIDALDEARRIVAKGVAGALEHWIGLLRPLVPCSVLLLVPPPPIESEAHIRRYPGPFRERLEGTPLRASGDRLKLWQLQRDLVIDFGRKCDLEVLQPIESVLSPSGFLATDCCGTDPTHGNASYGRRMFAHVLSALRDAGSGSHEAPLPHPYAELPDHAYWQQSISQMEPGSVDPVTDPKFLISSSDEVATAGSCFAQHISRRLRNEGFRFLVTEEVIGDKPLAAKRAFHDFSARYGNIYTARQLLQLFDRAFGYYKPLERVWPLHGGGFCDPFRPRIEAEGFPSKEAVEKDTQLHLDAVRRMFQRLDVFVFTLGLTECWISQLDGAAYPIAPGVVGGQYDPTKYTFVNFDVSAVKADMQCFLAKLAQVNPSARVLLTVSPVPLVATADDRHVLVATSYSKAVLRAAAGELARSHAHVEYFPSYEIITGPHARGKYFAADRRGVTEAGVDHVMRVFMARMTSGTISGTDDTCADDAKNAAYRDMEDAAEVACDEEEYARDNASVVSRH